MVVSVRPFYEAFVGVCRQTNTLKVLVGDGRPWAAFQNPFGVLFAYSGVSKEEVNSVLWSDFRIALIIYVRFNNYVVNRLFRPPHI